MCKLVLFFALLAVSAAQNASLSLVAAGEIGDSSAGAGVSGAGDEVVGEVTAMVDETKATATGTVVATSTTPSSPTPTPTPTPTTPSSPATASATASASASASGSGLASANAIAAASTKPAVVVEPSVVTPNPAPKAYYKKMVEEKPKPVCGDIKDDMCPAMSEFENCGYCILQKYPLKGQGCPVEKYMVAKEGKKGEYEVVTKPMCDCPEGALYIEDPKYCPSCDLVLMELLACSGIKEMPKDVSAIEITASCVEKVKVPVEFLVKCGFVKPPPSPVVVQVKEDKKDAKKYMMEEPKEKYIVFKPEEKSPKENVIYVPTSTPPPTVIVTPAAATATANAVATASGSATANADASASVVATHTPVASTPATADATASASVGI